ncbi:hypothetical protein JI58_00255 [Marinosulfonomonas sp. PRT-SC04]|nr:hypothetical protein JI58_00255 [Marinosulfonomonas sp. PRT-SC04]
MIERAAVVARFFEPILTRREIMPPRNQSQDDDKAKQADQVKAAAEVKAKEEAKAQVKTKEDAVEQAKAEEETKAQRAKQAEAVVKKTAAMETGKKEEAKKKAAREAEEKVKAPKGQFVLIKSTTDSRRRAGLKFTKEGVKINVDDLTKEQQIAIENDPRLSVSSL